MPASCGSGCVATGTRSPGARSNGLCASSASAASCAASADTLAWCLFAALAFGGLLVSGYPVDGSLRYALVLSLFGLAFSGIGVLLAQVSRTARGATGIGIGVALTLFLVRAVVDGTGTEATWLSPPGWVAQARPWGDTALWPYLALGMVAAASFLLAVALCAFRDLDSGLLPQRLGPARSGAGLATPLGLAWRLTRGTALGFCVGAVVWAAAVAMMSQEFVDVVTANPNLAQAFGGSAEHLATVLAVQFVAVLATSAGMSVALRPGAEEASARLGLLYAGRLPRWRWWPAWIGLALVAAAAVLLVSVTVLGFVQVAVMDRPDALADAIEAGIALVVPVLAMVAICALLVAVRPQLRGFAWLLPAWALLVAVLGEAIRMPDWLQETSPLHAVGKVPVEEADGGAILVLAALMAFALALSVPAALRRDLARG